MQRIRTDSRRVKLAGLTKVVLAANRDPDHAGPEGSQGEGGQFGGGYVDPHRLRGDSVFPHRFPCTAETRVLEAAYHEDGKDDQAQSYQVDIDGRVLEAQFDSEETGRGILAIPEGPEEKLFQFSITMRTISAKPRVTMAR